MIRGSLRIICAVFLSCLCFCSSSSTNRTTSRDEWENRCSAGGIGGGGLEKMTCPASRMAVQGLTRKSFRFHQLRTNANMSLLLIPVFSSLGYDQVDKIQDAFFIFCRHRDFKGVKAAVHQRFNHIPGETYMTNKARLSILLDALGLALRTAATPLEFLGEEEYRHQVRTAASLPATASAHMPHAFHTRYTHGCAALIEEVRKRVRATEIPNADEGDGSRPIEIRWILKPTGNASHRGRGIVVFTDLQLLRAFPNAEDILKSPRTPELISWASSAKEPYVPGGAPSTEWGGMKEMTVPADEGYDHDPRSSNDLNEVGICGRDAVVQEYIPSPFLLHGRKFDFRMYFAVISVDPPLVLYHEGFVRLAPSHFNATSDDVSSHITNQGYNSETETVETVEAVPWNMTTFTQYVVSEGLLPEDWYGRFNLAVKQFVRDSFWGARPLMARGEQYFGLFGIDIILGPSGRPWLVEIQKSPAVNPRFKGGSVIQWKYEMVVSVWKGLITIARAAYEARNQTPDRSLCSLTLMQAIQESAYQVVSDLLCSGVDVGPFADWE